MTQPMPHGVSSSQVEQHSIPEVPLKTQVADLLYGEAQKMKEDALASDVSKLMKAVVAQRKQIEAL